MSILDSPRVLLWHCCHPRKIPAQPFRAQSPAGARGHCPPASCLSPLPLLAWSAGQHRGSAQSPGGRDTARGRGTDGGTDIEHLPPSARPVTSTKASEGMSQAGAGRKHAPVQQETVPNVGEKWGSGPREGPHTMWAPRAPGRKCRLQSRRKPGWMSLIGQGLDGSALFPS